MILLTLDADRFNYLATVPRLGGFSFTVQDPAFAIFDKFLLALVYIYMEQVFTQSQTLTSP